MYKVGDVVKVKALIPQGSVTKMRMDEDGTIWYLMLWTNGEVTQERWFTDNELESVG